jgi:hypothetical protein
MLTQTASQNHQAALERIATIQLQRRKNSCGAIAIRFDRDAKDYNQLCQLCESENKSTPRQICIPRMQMLMICDVLSG